MRLNKGTRLASQSMNVEQFIEKSSERTPRYKTKLQQKQDRILRYTGKPVQAYNGIKNPVKLNISSDTLSKLNKK